MRRAWPLLSFRTLGGSFRPSRPPGWMPSVLFAYIKDAARFCASTSRRAGLRFEARSSLTNDVIAGAASAAVSVVRAFAMNQGVILACQAVSMASSGELVAALREALHTCRDQRQGTISVVFLMVGTTFQQPEETLNTCLRKAHQRSCAIHNPQP